MLPNLRARIECAILGHAVPTCCENSERCKACPMPCPACGWAPKKDQKESEEKKPC